MGVVLSIPVPPSVNNLYGNSASGRKRGRFKTRAYRAWIEAAGKEVMIQRPQAVKGKYRLFLTLPKIRGDASNRVKAAEDLLVSMGVIDDDRYAVSVHVEVVPEQRNFAIVSVEAA